MKQLLLALICFPVLLAAQSSWVTDLPVTGVTTSANLTADNEGIYVTTGMADTTVNDYYNRDLTIFRLDNDGELIKRNIYSYYSGAPLTNNGGMWGQGVLHQDKLITMGTISDSLGGNGFYFELNRNLDSLYYERMEEFASIRRFFSLNDNLIFRAGDILAGNFSVFKYINGITEKILDGDVYESLFDYEIIDDNLYSYRNESFDGYLYSYNWQEQEQEQDLVFELEPISTFGKNGNGEIILLTIDSSRCFSKNLEQKWSKPNGELTPSENTLNYKVNEIQATSDGGFVMIGYLRLFSGNPEFNIVFVAKVDAEGEREWWYAYALPLNNGLQIEEVEDGYICLGSDNLTSSMKVFKILKNGELTSTEDPEVSRLDIIAFPNPVGASGQAYLQFGKPYTGIVNLYDLNGRLLRTHQLEHATQYTISLGHFPEGMYIVQGQDPVTHELWSKKIIK